MSIRTVEGRIEVVSGKPWQGREGPITLYSFKLEGSNQWFRTGTNPLPVGKGASVKFVADGPNVDVSSIQQVEAVVQRAPAVPSAQDQSPTPSRGRPGRQFNRSAQDAGAKDQYWKDREARDLEKEERFRAVSEPRMAMSVAIQAAAPIIVAALQTDGLSLGNASKAKKLGIITEYTKELAADLARFIQSAPEVLATSKDGLDESGSSDGSSPESN